MQGKEKMNADIKDWGKVTISELKSAFAALKIEHVKRSPSPSPSVDQLLNKFGSSQGMLNRVGFKFPRHMVFVHKGVGKGVPIARAGSGSTTRRAKEWFTPIMDRQVEKLADIVAENDADLIINNLTIK